MFKKKQVVFDETKFYVVFLRGLKSVSQVCTGKEELNATIRAYRKNGYDAVRIQRVKRG